jgi:hypothetical protein
VDILNNQSNLRTENLQGIADDNDRGCVHDDEMGKAIILPASHIGGI